MAAVMTQTTGQALHSAGLFADTGLNGPQIGELVLVVDRAKNLPNRRTLGKQDPYCAARFGKEAKKTGTDRRGGQTPRWNEELKFNVYDSVDHHQIKISLFNDDKKTDLIGETMVALDHILKHGGGQSDDWHTLQWKGRYAGEVLIEFTFYDHRPREEKSKSSNRERKQSTTTTPSDSPTTTGPRPEPAVKRRPLPTEPDTSLPQQRPIQDQPSTLRSQISDQYIPRAEDDHSMTIANGSQAHYYEDIRPLPPAPFSHAHTNQNSLYDATDASVAPLRSSRAQVGYQHPNESSSSRDFEDQQSFETQVSYVDHGSSRLDPYSSSPYGYDAEQFPLDLAQPHPLTPITPPRHDRVEALSTSPSKRPSPPELLHAHSDPTFGPQQRLARTQEYHNGQQSYSSYNSASPTYVTRGVDFRGMPGYAPSLDSSSYNARGEQRPQPPSAPMHRNSAPIYPHTKVLQVQQFPGQEYTQISTQRRSYQHPSSAGPTRPLPNPATTGYALEQPNYHPPRRSTYSNDDGYMYSQSALRAVDNSSLPYQESYNEETLPAPLLSTGGPTIRQQQYPRQRPHSFVESSSAAHPFSQNMQNSHRRYDIPPNTSVVPIIEKDPRNVQVTRKSVSPHSTPPSTNRSSVPFSPDSYNDLNPSTTRSPPVVSNSKEPSPMYTAQSSTSTTTAKTPSSNNNNINGPIVRNDGAVIDPSDHLPGHTWAPEPESTGKQKRPTTVVNIKRFGPRDAPSPPSSTYTPVSRRSGPRTPEITTNNSGGNRLQKRTPSGSSPLSPTMPATLNAVTNSPYPPPVPAKIPLNGSRSGIEDYEPGGSMAALSEEMRNIDIGPSKASGVTFQKTRKHKFMT